MKTTKIRDFTNAAGRRTMIKKITFSDGGKSSVIQCTYAKTHPMYTKLGVDSSELYSFEGGRQRFYKLEGAVLGERFEFRSDTRFAENTLKDLKEFVKTLTRVRKYKPTKFLENVINVTRHIK